MRKLSNNTSDFQNWRPEELKHDVEQPESNASDWKCSNFHSYQNPASYRPKLRATDEFETNKTGKHAWINYCACICCRKLSNHACLLWCSELLVKCSNVSKIFVSYFLQPAKIITCIFFNAIFCKEHFNIYVCICTRR